MAAPAADPVSAIAGAIGDGFKTITAGLGIVANRDRDLSARNAYEQQLKGWEYGQNAQRLGFLTDGLGYLNNEQNQGTQTLLILSALIATIVIAFALLHRRR